jgi:hypothetical protein
MKPKKYDTSPLPESIVEEPALAYAYTQDTLASTEQVVLQPDDDFYRALSAEEFRKRLAVVLENVDKKYASK